MTENKLNLPQKVLYISLYLLIALMLLFSFMSLENRGQDGYDNCIQKKCEAKGEKYCSKFREINNCCLGAGGKLGSRDGKNVCVFS